MIATTGKKGTLLLLLGFVMASMQQRKEEILAKRAKLAELKRQRELRQQEFTQTRASSGDASEVWMTELT